MQHAWPRRIRWPGLVVAASLLAGCGPPAGTLEAVLERKTLTVGTLNGPTTYYEGAHGPQGAQYELAEAFAKRLGVSLHMVTFPDEPALREALDDGDVDLVAAAMTPDEAWLRVALPSATTLEVPQWVVGHRGDSPIASLQALQERRLVVRQRSPQEALLRERSLAEQPDLAWDILRAGDDDPLQVVNSQPGTVTLVDADAFAYAQHLYPQVVRLLRWPTARTTSWLVPRRSGLLLARVDAFLGELQQRGKLAALLADAAPDNPRFELNVSQSLVRDIEVELPALRPHFEAAGTATGFDWRLLAAVSYVESRWQATAASRDGAQGLMMLTENTAGSLGVTDRNDPQQSVFAGARYLVQVRNKIPERIGEPDRTWLTIAAYNVGFGHLEDARVLAQQRGGNADRWEDVAKVLPLLADERYYARARRGYARGWEPVRMVEKVQLFLKLLEWQGESLARPLPGPEPG